MIRFLGKTGEKKNSESLVILGAGGSRGIGGASARKLASENYHVILSGRTVEKVQPVAEEIRNQGNSAIAMQVDVSATKDQDSLFEHVKSRDKVSAVLSNASNNANIPSRKELLDSLEELGHIGHFSPQNVQFSLSNGTDLEAFLQVLQVSFFKDEFCLQ